MCDFCIKDRSGRIYFAYTSPSSFNLDKKDAHFTYLIMTRSIIVIVTAYGEEMINISLYFSAQLA